MESQRYYYSHSFPSTERKIFIWTVDENGRRTGEYYGYYRDRTQTIILYPAKGSAMFGPLQKHEISDRLLRVV